MYLFPHNPQWTLEFEQESKAIMAVYDAEIELHHIGSTAVPGLLAKDCIDILGVVPKLSTVNFKAHKLTALGFENRGTYGIPGRAYFSKPVRKTHLHIFESANPNIEKHMEFVQIMRSNENLVEELNALKAELHHKYPEQQNHYQQEKAFFYQQLFFNNHLL